MEVLEFDSYSVSRDNDILLFKLLHIRDIPLNYDNKSNVNVMSRRATRAQKLNMQIMPNINKGE